jgi:hypothetical protein
VSAFVNDVIAEAEADEKVGNVGKIGNVGEVGKIEAPPPPSVDEPPSLAPEPEPAFDAPVAEPAEGDAAPPVFAYDASEPPTISDAPPLVPPDDHHDGADAAEDHENADYAARRARMRARRQKTKRNTRWIAVVLVLFGLNIAIIAGRHQIVRYLPQTASLFASIGLPVNLRNLEFEGIKISKEAQDGVTILIIEGRIVNTVGSATDVPRLRFAARNASGQEIYTWSMQPTRSILGPGENLPFTSRLAAPPADAVDILVRFFTKQDVASGMK